MELDNGVILRDVTKSELRDFLGARMLRTHITDPKNLKITDKGKKLYLQIFGKEEKELPVRRAFLHKLLSWYSFPLRQLKHLNIETVAAICNDYLLSISSPQVRIVIENEQALTITSMKYSVFTDLELLDYIKDLEIKKVSRDDFMTRFYFDEKYKMEPIPGDKTGFGYNILNSETGFMSLNFVSYMTRYICTNGAVMRTPETSCKIYHYNNNRDKFTEFLTDKLNDTKNLSEEFAKEIALSATVSLEKKLNTVQRHVDLITGGEKRIGIAGKLEERNSIYDAANLITSSAKEYEPYTRLRLETFAGSLMLNKVKFKTKES